MSNHRFHLAVSFNETSGEPVAAYVGIREGKVVETKEVNPGNVFADYAADGVLLGIELLGPCPSAVIERVAADEPECVQRFLRRGIRQGMIVA